MLGLQQADENLSIVLRFTLFEAKGLAFPELCVQAASGPVIRMMENLVFIFVMASVYTKQMDKINSEQSAKVPALDQVSTDRISPLRYPCPFVRLKPLHCQTSLRPEASFQDRW